MKNRFALFFVLLILGMSFASCNSNEHDLYESLISDSANDELGINSEVEFWTGTYFEKTDMADQTCCVNNQNYTGQYVQSIVDKMNSYTTDIYKDPNHIEFGLRSDNGELAYINFMNAQFFDSEPYLPELSNQYEAAITQTRNVASEFVDDIADYTQIVESPVTRYKEREGVTYEITYYTVTYARKIGNYYSSDYISVKVTSKGNVASIMMGDINAFDQVVLDFDESSVNKSISSKIDSTFQKIKFHVNHSDIQDQKIVLTPDGTVCLYSDIIVTVADDSGFDKETGINIITVIGKVE